MRKCGSCITPNSCCPDHWYADVLQVVSLLSSAAVQHCTSCILACMCSCALPSARFAGLSDLRLSLAARACMDATSSFFSGVYRLVFQLHLHPTWVKTQFYTLMPTAYKLAHRQCCAASTKVKNSTGYRASSAAWLQNSHCIGMCKTCCSSVFLCSSCALADCPWRCLSAALIS